MRFLGLISVILFFAAQLAFSQSPKDMVEDLADEKKYAEAVKHIPDAVKKNWKDEDFLFLCGNIYFELNNYDKALEMYERVEKIEGDEPYILRKKGEVLSLMDKHKEAFKALKEAIEEDEKDVQSYLALANAYIRADSINQAEMTITKAKGMDKKNADVFISLGDLYFAQRVYQLAKENYEKALSIDEDLTEARIKLATSYYWLATKEVDQELSNELFSRSLKEWNKVTQADSMNANAFFQQGKILFFSHRYAPAAQSLYRYVQLRPNGDIGRWYLAQSLYEVNKCDSAVIHLEKVADRIDSVANKARLYLARCQFDNKNYEKAVEVYEKLDASDTLVVKDYKRYGGSALNTGDTAKAIDIYIKTIERYPDKTCNLMYGVGKTMLKYNKHDVAVKLFDKRINTEVCKDEKLALTHYWKGIGLLFAERPDSIKPMTLDTARQAFAKSIELDSTHLSAYVYLGDVNTNLENKEEAEELFLKAINMAKQDTAQYSNELNQAYSKICGLKFEANEYNTVIKLAEDWADYFPKKHVPYLYLAVGYHGLKNKERACNYYKKVLGLDPDNNMAKKNLQSLQCP